MKRILIIDDDVKITRLLVNDLINKHRFEVVWLQTAYDILKTLKGSLFDAVILDIMMPIPEDWTIDEKRRSANGLATGIILFEKIRNVYPLIPIIIYSAKKATIKDKYTSFLSKPEFPDVIVEHLNKLISNEN